jgi:hypothetical protein
MARIVANNNGSYYADLPHESPPKGVASWQTEMSALLLTTRRVTCGAVYEQLMEKRFQQGFKDMCTTA